MEQRAQALGLLAVKAPVDMVWDGRAGLQARQALAIEGVDGVAHGLVIATQLRGNLDGRLAAGIGQQDLAAAQRERLGGA